MAMKLKVINKQTLDKLNAQLGALQELYDETCKAKDAGIPGMEAVQESCRDMKAKIEKFKAVYFADQM